MQHIYSMPVVYSWYAAQLFNACGIQLVCSTHIKCLWYTAGMQHTVSVIWSRYSTPVVYSTIIQCLWYTEHNVCDMEQIFNACGIQHRYSMSVCAIQYVYLMSVAGSTDIQCLSYHTVQVFSVPVGGHRYI